LLFGGEENAWKTPVFDDFSERDSMESMAWDDFLSAPALQNGDSIRRWRFPAIDPRRLSDDPKSGLRRGPNRIATGRALVNGLFRPR
jgi:hypothetical protein